jgi:hypothetical protein
MIEKRNLFEVPSWKIQTINFEEKKKELVKLLESYPEEEKKGEQEFSTNRQTDRSGLIEGVFLIMKQEFEDFSKEIKKDFAITETWSVSYVQGDCQLPHNHGSMGLTGILYLDLPKDSPKTEYIRPWNDYENDTVPHCKIPIVEGDIIIIPSFVMHYSKPNRSENTKRIVSWDMKILDESKFFQGNTFRIKA